MMIHKMKIHWLLALPALLLAAGCSESTLPGEEEPDGERAELQVSPQVALTRGAIHAGTDASAMGSIAVYASNTVTNATTNNYGLYTYGGSAWANTDPASKIYLSAEEATIYAHYPAWQPATGGALATSGTALKVNGSGQVTAASTVNISVFPGTAGQADSKITVAGGASGTVPATAPGEVDYMYADQSTPPTASYKKGETGKDAKVVLQMKHALAMVSFRVYADHTYQRTGALTKLVIANGTGASLINDGGQPVMKIGDGAITSGSTPSAVTYTRDIEGYTLKKATADTDAARTVAQAASDKVGVLLLPQSDADKTNVKITLTIDGLDYVIDLGNSTENVWTAGNNYLYTVRFKGKELSVTSVTVTPWTEVVVKDPIKIN